MFKLRSNLTLKIGSIFFVFFDSWTLCR